MELALVAALVLSICVWFVAPDMVDLLWVSTEVKRGGAVVVCGLWILACMCKNYFCNNIRRLRLQI